MQKPPVFWGFLYIRYVLCTTLTEPENPLKPGSFFVVAIMLTLKVNAMQQKQWLVSVSVMKTFAINVFKNSYSTDMNDEFQIVKASKHIL